MKIAFRRNIYITHMNTEEYNGHKKGGVRETNGKN